MKQSIPMSYWLTLSMPQGGAYCTARPTFAEAMAEAFSMATFYLSEGRGDAAPYPHVTCKLGEHCAECHGSGKKGFTRTRRPIKCPACGGKDTSRAIVETEFRAYDNGGRDYVALVMRERHTAGDAPVVSEATQ